MDLDTQETITHCKQKLLGPWASTSLVAGSMLGIGIFIGPPLVAAELGGYSVFLALWALGGLLALSGALSVAELGAMMPRAGGDYPYLLEAFGPGVAFAAGWLQLGVIFPGSLATMAVATATYQIPVLLGGTGDAILLMGFPVPPSVWAALILLVLTAVNHRGVVISGRVQLILTCIPVSFLLLGSVWALWYGGAPSAPLLEDPTQVTITGLSSAYLPVYFAFSGWYAALFIGSEVQRPDRYLPIALIGGTTFVAVLYLMICAALLAIFSIPELAQTGEAGTAAARRLLGPAGASIMAFSIATAMLGSINCTVLTGARIAFAMALQGQCPVAAARLHPTFKTPSVALWMQTGWALVLVLIGQAETLLSYTTAAMLITGTLTVLSVPRLRRLRGDLQRPYRAWLYPWTPMIYTGSTLCALIALLSQGDLSVLLALGWFTGAYLIYLVRGRRVADKGGDDDDRAGRDL